MSALSAPAALHNAPRLERSPREHNAETVPMQTWPMQRPVPATSRLHSEAIQFRIILGATYPFFLAAALAQRVLPGRRTRSGFAPQRRSVFGEAKAMAVSAIPFAFMG